MATDKQSTSSVENPPENVYPDMTRTEEAVLEGEYSVIVLVGQAERLEYDIPVTDE